MPPHTLERLPARDSPRHPGAAIVATGMDAAAPTGDESTTTRQVSAATGESAVGRVARIMAVFRDCHGPVRITEIAQRTQLSPSSVSRTVKELISHGLLERRGNGVVVGMPVFELGARVPRAQHLRHVALPVLADLRRLTGLRVHLAVLDDRHVVFLETMSGTKPDTSSIRAGYRAPAHATAVGKALLAHFPPEWLNLYLQSPLTEARSHAITSPQRLRRELADIRAGEPAYDHGQTSTNLCCLARPILRPTGLPLAAISLSGPCDQLASAHTAPALQEATARLTRHVRTDHYFNAL
jgi:DNA-binding IclR family transcriptional regulator